MDIRYFLIYLSAFIGLFGVIFYTLGLFSKKDKEIKVVEKDLPKTTIIIPAYNEEKGIENTIKSALSLNYPRDKLEIIVVDDGSKDNTYKLAKKFAGKNVFVYTKKNAGKGSALNFGIKKARGEIVVTMDADTLVDKDALKNMIKHFTNQKVMCVTPAMILEKPRGILQRIQQIEYLLGVFLRKAFANMNAIHITPGAFSAYRKSFFDKYGGFDEKNITEDLEIALRIQYHHYTIENSTDATVRTVAPNKFTALLKQRRRWYFGLISNLSNYRKLFSKEYGDLGIIVLPIALITIFLSVALTLYAFIFSLFEIKKQLILFSSINFNIFDFGFINKYIIQKYLFMVVSNPLFLFSIIFILILFGYMAFAKAKVNERGIKFSLLLFLAFYSFLFALWWIISFFYLGFKKRISWGKK